jgi:rSAM/selenodomain-associated transferase 1
MRHLLLFGKLPRTGRVKTRLIPRLSPEQTCRLYRAFLTDQLRLLRAFDGFAATAWWTDEQPGLAELAALAAEPIDVRLQCAGDLGTRLLDAFERTCSGSRGGTVIFGADCPTLPADRVRAAFAKLERGSDAVIVPADDGGYVLVGMCRPIPALFDGVPWGGPEVAAATRRLAARHGLMLAELEPWYDVDESTSLDRLSRETRDPAVADRAPETVRCMVDLGIRPVV